MSRGQRIRKMCETLAIPLWWTLALFGSAGQLTWTRGWICTVLYLGALIASREVLKTVNPDLLKQREGKLPENTKPFDKVFLKLFLLLTFVLPAIAGLDAVRFRWTALASWSVFAGIGLFVAAATLITWTLAKNPHAESSVRIQEDRGHTVIVVGPYRFVRHPMYVGLILLYIAMALVLGSGMTLALAFFIAALFFWRTAQEDRTLRQELPGYEEYTAVTRYRLMPGVW